MAGYIALMDLRWCARMAPRSGMLMAGYIALMDLRWCARMAARSGVLMAGYIALMDLLRSGQMAPRSGMSMGEISPETSTPGLHLAAPPGRGILECRWSSC